MLPVAMVGVETVHVARHAGALAEVVGEVVVIDPKNLYQNLQ